MGGMEININIGMDGISIKKSLLCLNIISFFTMLKMPISKVADGIFYNMFIY